MERDKISEHIVAASKALLYFRNGGVAAVVGDGCLPRCFEDRFEVGSKFSDRFRFGVRQEFGYNWCIGEAFDAHLDSHKRAHGVGQMYSPLWRAGKGKLPQKLGFIEQF